MRRTTLALTLAAVALAAGLSHIVGEYPRESLEHRPRLDEGALELTLKADKATYALGDTPYFSATITNKTSAPVPLVRPLDGSSRGRHPQAMFSIVPPPNAMPKPQLDMCGNSDPMTMSAFFTLAPGDTFTWRADLLPNELDRGPGVYSLQLTYSTDSNEPESWLGGPLTPRDSERLLSGIGPLLRKVPRLTIVSNRIEIEFTTGFASPLDALANGSVSDACWALRALDSAAPSADIAAAIVDVIERPEVARAESNYEFYDLALPMLVKHASSAEVDRFWTCFVADRASNYRSRIVDDQHVHDLLALVLGFPGPQREERLRTLLIYTKRRTSEECWIDLTPTVINQVAGVSGKDVDRVLKERFDAAITEGRIGMEAFAALCDSLVKRGVVSKDEASNARPVGL
ncbi:MAG: hypothetical protein FJY92_01685 [Candidatus Hydrogenedentes bacterium]|nr:hypothetical protein [Candidatus Hydrogenedentota bacterium]